MTCTKSLHFLFCAYSLEKGICSNNSLGFFALFFLFICVVFLPQWLNLCSRQYCLTHLPAASREQISLAPVAAGDFVRLNTRGLFNSVLFFLFCPVGLALIPHWQMKCNAPKVLIRYVIYLLHKYFSFFTSQQLLNTDFPCCETTKKTHYVLQCQKSPGIEEERVCGRRGKGKILPTANSSACSELTWERTGLKPFSWWASPSGCLLSLLRWLTTSSLLTPSRCFLTSNHSTWNKQLQIQWGTQRGKMLINCLAGKDSQDESWGTQIKTSK